jgi:hypothetical protein
MCWLPKRLLRMELFFHCEAVECGFRPDNK